MIYRNTEMKLDQLVGYLNEEKINLSPVFQRGHVWTIGTRRKLVKNIVQGRPIPAIFLYKEPEGTRYSYNILDGKQRLESLILFIGNRRKDFRIDRWGKYFFGERDKKDVDFWIELPNGKKSSKNLDSQVVRDFREYAIPTIEINLPEDQDTTTLDEIINLFVDINQQGVPVNRFGIVKAIGRTDNLLRGVFQLVAEEQRRGQDVFYRANRSDFTKVLKNLNVVAALPDGNAKVDRMWERLLEIVLFFRTKKHRRPIEILKSFIRVPTQHSVRLTEAEIKRLRKIFTFLVKAYKQSKLGETRLATDQTHFYIMITSLIGGELLNNFAEGDLIKKLVAFSRILEGKSAIPRDEGLPNAIERYQELSEKQTTDVSRREERQRIFIDAISAL